MEFMSRAGHIIMRVQYYNIFLIYHLAITDSDFANSCNSQKSLVRVVDCARLL